MLDLDDLAIETPPEGARYILFGALASEPYADGDDNVLHLVLRRSEGGGTDLGPFFAQ